MPRKFAVICQNYKTVQRLEVVFIHVPLVSQGVEERLARS